MTAGGVIPAPEERSPYMRPVGQLLVLASQPLAVGVDHDTVTIGPSQYTEPIWRLSQAQAEEFGRLFVAACWQAAANKRRMDEDVVDATIHAADCTSPGCKGECDG